MDVAVYLKQTLYIQTKEVVILREVSCASDVIQCCRELLPQIDSEFIAEILKIEGSQLELEYCFADKLFFTGWRKSPEDWEVSGLDAFDVGIDVVLILEMSPTDVREG